MCLCMMQYGLDGIEYTHHHYLCSSCLHFKTEIQTISARTSIKARGMYSYQSIQRWHLYDLSMQSKNVHLLIAHELKYCSFEMSIKLMWGSKVFLFCFFRGGVQTDVARQPGQRFFVLFFFCFSLQLILQPTEGVQWFYYRENYTFQGSRGRPTFSRGGGPTFSTGSKC